MPTYEYECNACGHQLEAIQNFSEDALKKCPKCNKHKLERLISGGAGFIFKGSGFYETDYRKENYESEAKKDKENSSSKKSEKKDPKSKKKTASKKKKD